MIYRVFNKKAGKWQMVAETGNQTEAQDVLQTLNRKNLERVTANLYKKTYMSGSEQ